MLAGTPVWMQQLYDVVRSPVSNRKKMEPVCGNRRRSGEQRTRGKANAVLTGKETALFVFFVLN